MPAPTPGPSTQPQAAQACAPCSVAAAAASQVASNTGTPMDAQSVGIVPSITPMPQDDASTIASMDAANVFAPESFTAIKTGTGKRQIVPYLPPWIEVFDRPSSLQNALANPGESQGQGQGSSGEEFTAGDAFLREIQEEQQRLNDGIIGMEVVPYTPSSSSCTVPATPRPENQVHNGKWTSRSAGRTALNRARLARSRAIDAELVARAAEADAANEARIEAADNAYRGSAVVSVCPGDI